jgi:hypothetical protein
MLQKLKTKPLATNVDNPFDLTVYLQQAFPASKLTYSAGHT